MAWASKVERSRASEAAWDGVFAEEVAEFAACFVVFVELELDGAIGSVGFGALFAWTEA